MYKRENSTSCPMQNRARCYITPNVVTPKISFHYNANSEGFRLVTLTFELFLRRNSSSPFHNPQPLWAHENANSKPFCLFGVKNDSKQSAWRPYSSTAVLFAFVSFFVNRIQAYANLEGLRAEPAMSNELFAQLRLILALPDTRPK
jgi:hypothetical protein